MPLLTTASAISRMSLSLTLHPNLFQLFHPIGGVGARDADACADVAGASRVARVPTRRQARSARIEKNHRMFIFPRNIGYVTAYAESSTQLQEARCRATPGENSSAHAHAAQGNLTAFGRHKYSTGVNPLQAHREAQVRKLSHAKGGVAGRALQVYRPPHSNRAARGSVSLLKSPSGSFNPGSLDDGDVAVDRKIG